MNQDLKTGIRERTTNKNQRQKEIDNMARKERKGKKIDKNASKNYSKSQHIKTS